MDSLAQKLTPTQTNLTNAVGKIRMFNITRHAFDMMQKQFCFCFLFGNF